MFATPDVSSVAVRVTKIGSTKTLPLRRPENVALVMGATESMRKVSSFDPSAFVAQSIEPKETVWLPSPVTSNGEV